MLVPPAGLSEDAIARTVMSAYGIPVESLQYLPVGFGSHHWAAESCTQRWFLSVDPISDDLRNALAMAGRAQSLGFPVAPIPTLAQEPLAAIDGRYCVAVYPFLHGVAGRFSDDYDDPIADQIVHFLTQLHALETSERKVEPFAGLPAPEGLDIGAKGPFAESVTALLDEYMAVLRSTHEQLRRVVVDRVVLTHGEPHPGNWMATQRGLRLVDWDTARLAPPERDIWHVARRSGIDVVGLYERRAQWVVDRPMLDHYAAAWLYSDVDACVTDLAAATDADAQTDFQVRVLKDALLELAER